MDANSLRRLNWLWKHRHTHTDDTTLEQLTIITQSVQDLESSSAASMFTAASVHLQADAQEIPEEGAAVEWSAYDPFPQVDFTVDLPATAIIIPRDGYYNVTVRLAWDDWLYGGTLELVRTRPGEPPFTFSPPDWSATLAQGGRFLNGTAHALPLMVGDQVEVFIFHGDVDPHVLAAADIAVYLVEAFKPQAAPLPPPPPEPPPDPDVDVFLESGVWDWEAHGSPETVDVWIIAGGGGGGGCGGTSRGAGGGGGQVKELTGYPVSGNIAVIVGEGGESGCLATDGGVSSFDGVEALGGGAGRGGFSDGGSGGGGTVSATGTEPPGSGVDGNDGGAAHTGNADSRSAGGGGGAGGPGSAGTSGQGGDGGPGVDLSAIVGTGFGANGWFGGGGGGGCRSAGGEGGQGGGGQGGGADNHDCTPGLPGSGGGGGGRHLAMSQSYAPGGKGCVIVRVN